ncbi:MAG TPA: universal stress protein [Burkholderiales bacterium]|nr:universal stress protein [Burkholderiales bacterium]
MRIFAATDGSEGATRAVERAARLAQTCGAQLFLVTVGSGRLTAEEVSMAKSLGIAQGDLLERFSGEILVRATAAARAAGATQIETSDCIGEAAETLLDVARRDKPDLLVVGRRGRGRVAGLVLGSVSQKLAASAPCAVLIVP